VKSFVLRRVLQFVPVFFLLTFFVFFLLRVAPGDAARIRLSEQGRDLDREEIARERRALGLDRPLMYQYAAWLGRVVRGDFGVSMVTDENIKDEITRRWTMTVLLSLPSVLIALLFALPLGIIAAVNESRPIDTITKIFSIVFHSVPSFCTGLLAILLFSVYLGLLPSFGAGSVRHMILPCAVITISTAAFYTRFIRGLFLEEFSKDYVRAERARGVSLKTIIFRNALKNAALPLVTSFGMSLALTLGGQAVVEKVFSWPGMGSYLIDRILRRDYPAVEAACLLYVFLFSGINLAADLLCAVLDPKIRRGEQNNNARGGFL
jgi:peptide/nickel transport system permease protein